MTTGVDVVLAAYASLSLDERETAWQRLTELHLDERAKNGGQTSRCVTSLRRVAEYVGRENLSVEQYRAAYRELRAEGADDVLEVNVVIKHFGSWVYAKEALLTSAEDSPLQIERRLRWKLLAKAHKYSDDDMKAAIQRCAKEIGHVPLVAEYDAWRQREIELARSRGEREIWIPSDSPFRYRWKSWERALRECGFTEEQLAERHRPKQLASYSSPKRYRPPKKTTVPRAAGS